MTPIQQRVRPVRLAGLAILAIMFGFSSNAQAASPPVPSGSPLAGSAMWVWYTPKPDRLPAMIAQLKRAHMNSVFVKSGDGSTTWHQFNRALVDKLHAAGLHVCAWHYVYGTHPIPEAKVSAEAYRAGAECMIIDAETEYEGRSAAAKTYTSKLRSLTSPRWLIGLSTFPYLKYHARFPYRTFLRPGAATVNLPQMYWRDIGVSPAKIVQDTYKVNRALGRLVYPIGQTWNAPNNGELKAFQRAVKRAGAQGVSWWDWSQTSKNSWNELASQSSYLTAKPSTSVAIRSSTQKIIAKSIRPVANLITGVSLQLG